MFEAVVGDAEGGEPGVEEVGVAVAVLLEGAWGGVELAAVEFDDEVVGSVDGVDFVAGYALVELCFGGLRTSARSTSVRAGVVTRIP